MIRILLVRLGALGDIVHALPAAAALRAALPDARIDWLVEAKHRALLDLVPVLDDRIVIDSRAWTGARAPLSVIRRLRRTRYDVALDLQGLIKSAVLARASGARRVLGYATPHLREPAACHFYTAQIDPGRAPHVVDKARTTALRALAGEAVPARASSAESDGERDTRDLAAHDRAAREHADDAAQNAPFEFPIVEPASPVPACTRQLLGLWPDEPFVLLNPGAAWPNKRWPPDRFGALARELRVRHGLKSAVLWGPREETLAAQVAAASEGAAEMAPATAVADVVALARAARLFVSGDTGPIHLAAAVGTPVVGIYGPTDPRRNGPWRPEDECLSRFERCACHHQRRCRRDAWCLTDIPVSEVLAAVERRLAHDV